MAECIVFTYGYINEIALVEVLRKIGWNRRALGGLGCRLDVSVVYFKKRDRTTIVKFGLVWFSD